MILNKESEETNMDFDDFDYEESVYLAAELLEKMEQMQNEAEGAGEEDHSDEKN